MRKPLLFCFFLLFVSTCFCQILDKAAIHRIGDYGKLWTVINLFHPQMGYREVNADSLFTDNIDELLKDPSAANFKKAVQKMLERLHDPYTSIDAPDKNDTIQFADRPLLKWIADSIAVLHFDDKF